MQHSSIWRDKKGDNSSTKLESQIATPAYQVSNNMSRLTKNPSYYTFLQQKWSQFGLTAAHENKLSNLARAAGSQVEGTAWVTWSRSRIRDLDSATEYSEMYQPSKASDLVPAASFCQQPEKSNMLLNMPDGIFPVNESSRLNCSDICKNTLPGSK